MFLYLFFQKLKYWLKAKNLHGVHSPFVYHFNEKILNRPCSANNQARFPFWEQMKLNSKQSIILDRISTCYRINTVHFLDQRFEISAEKDAGQLLLFTDLSQIPKINNSADIVVFIGPYASKETNVAWQNLIKDSKTPLSIDVFELGILFFREEFLVKQHFVLKC